MMIPAKLTLVACLVWLGTTAACGTSAPGEITPESSDAGAEADVPEAGAACVPGPDGVELCNGLDDDCNGVVDDVAADHPQLQTDVLNCGSCGQRCAVPNAASFCRGGECGFVCRSGFSDIDGDASNGCEIGCVLTNGGVENCDGIDNDCDDKLDEGFDLNYDVENCGACGRACDLPGTAQHACEVGDCLAVECEANSRDLNGDPSDGCEYECLTDEAQLEVCNGVDDDCDGLVDAQDDDMAPPNFACLQRGVCEGVQPLCDGGWRCPYPPATFTAEREQACDGLDNDCDGEVDEDFPGKGERCSRGLGVCASYDRWICTPDGSALMCPAEEEPARRTEETCDGLDNDCDGFVDNEVTDLDWVQVGSFRIFRYEASRPDAIRDSGGNIDGAACSRPDVLPWYDVDYERAALACRLVGWRLCTEEEWRMSCAGPAQTRYPYGNDYRGLICNGADFGAGEVMPTGGGELEDCESGYGAREMSGNLKEWTSTPASEDGRPVHRVLGGAYDNRAPESLTCDGIAIPRNDEFHYMNLGFRCCWSLQD